MPSIIDGETLRLFDEGAMSGLPPGTHAARYFRVRMAKLKDLGQRQWVSLSWHHDPDRVLAFDDLTPGPEMLPLFELASSSGPTFFDQLLVATTDHHRQVHICGTCRFWRISGQNSPDALPLGRCMWQDADHTDQESGNQPEANRAVLAIQTQLALQSCLALHCPTWAERPHVASPDQSTTPADTPGEEPVHTPAPVQPTMVQRVRQWFHHRRSSDHKPADERKLLLEQSGVGAGTDPCPVCHGRIANLGSLLVTAPEEDEETLSIWRCRNCQTLYLNDWIDRWVRVASLTTEEFLYRISPAQAARILYMFRPERFGIQPTTQHSAAARRKAILHMVRDVQPVLYRAKQGR